MIYCINDNTDHKNHMIDNIYKVFIVENVVQYSLIDFNTHHIEACEKKEEPIHYYFAIDLSFHDAFGHWVYESAIYLPIFNKLKEIYPTIKILLKEKKQFKLLFLKFFHIMETDIVYDIQPHNVCLFPSPISALNDNHYLTNTYKQILLQFITIFTQYLTSNDVPHVYDYIILPRQTKENYKGNDRSYHMELIYEAVRSISQNYDTLHTDTIVDLKDQIAAVQSAPNVILTDGSPFTVNNLFCNNQKIFVLDTITIQQSTYMKCNYIREMICRLHHNSYTYIPTHLSQKQIIELLRH